MTKTIGNDSHEGEHNVSSFFNYQLQDGFHEIFTYRGHRLQLRGLNAVEWSDDARRQTGFYYRQHFLSWDVKQVILWRQDFVASQNEPQTHPVTINHIRFSNQPNFIAAIVHVHKLKVFLAVALDMSFKLFDRQLLLLESIRHDERAILQLEYDASKDLIFTSGATGISAWRLYRNTSLDKAHVMEKLYSFSGCSDWITKMIYEPQFNRIYALKERTAQVISMSRKAVVTVLEECHDAPINVVCWYERNQFYLTGCCRGEIKCWTSNYTTNADKHMSSGPTSPGRSQNPAEHPSAKVFALLHTFPGHTKAVTSIRLHPISGLAISTGMDGFVKVLNLEALNELFSIKLDCGILNMQVLKMGPHGHGCILTLSDASIKLWKITSVCDFFATSSSRIRQINSFENLESELEYFYKLKYALTQTYQQEETKAIEAGANEEGEKKPVEGGNEHANGEEEEGEEGLQKNSDTSAAAAAAQQANEVKKEDAVDTGKTDDRVIATFSSQDLRCFSHKGQLLGRLEPEHIVDGIKAYTVSVYQKILICLCEKDKVRVHDLRRFTFPLLHEFSLHGNKTGNNDAQAGDSPEPVQHKKALKDDMGVCVALVDIAPGNILRSAKGPKQKLSDDHDYIDEGDVKRDIRGNIIPDYIESYLLIGLNTGSILFLDTLNNFEVQMNFQANNGVVEDMKYRRRLRQLLVLGKDFSETFSTVRIWQLPEMELVAEVSNLRKVSCFAISLSTSYFAVGTTAGTVRIFNVNAEEKTVNEVGRVSENHDQAVTGLCFCDEVRVLCSSSMDCRVKFWDFDKRLVRTILLNLPTCGVIQNGKPGDVVMAQNHYLLTIPKRIWDEGDILDDMRQQSQNTAADTKTTLEDQIDEQKQNRNDTSAAGPAVGNSHESGKGFLPPPIALPTEDNRQNQPIVSATPSNRKNPGRRSSRRGSKAIATLDSDTQSDAGVSRKSDKRRTSFGSMLSEPAEDATPQNDAAAFTEEMEQQVLLPQLQAAQFQYLKGQKGAIQEENSVESVYSRMQQYSSVDGDKSKTAAYRHRPSDPFIFDTLHPRFLLHKKPPARAMQLEEVEDFSSYLTNLNSLKNTESQNNNFLNAGLVRYRENSLNAQQKNFVAEQPGESKARRIAQFGLSPRARMTLINSKPMETGLQVSASLSKSDEAGQSTSELVNAVKGVAANSYMAKAKENIICSMAIAMKVSSNYRNHRKSIMQARQDRFNMLKERTSVLVAEKDHELLMEKYRDGMMLIREHALEEEEDDGINHGDGRVEEQEEIVLSLPSQTPKETMQQSVAFSLPETITSPKDNIIVEEPRNDVPTNNVPIGNANASRSRKPIRPQLVNRTKSGRFIG